MSIELPRDAEGREIPLDTEVLYDLCETKVSVKEFLFRTLVESQKTEWTIKAQYEGNMYYNSFKPKDMHITQPDSWKKLLEDLSEAGDARYDEACAYFHRDKDEDGCISCPGGEDGCVRIAMRDILTRIRKLRGENDG